MTVQNLEQIPPHEAASMTEEMREQFYGTPEQDTGITADSSIQPEGVRLKKITSRRQ